MKCSDVIFCSGFSRGAYQVRALAGMIERVLSVAHRIVAYPLIYQHRLVFSRKAMMNKYRCKTHNSLASLSFLQLTQAWSSAYELYAGLNSRSSKSLKSIPPSVPPSPASMQPNASTNRLSKLHDHFALKKPSRSSDISTESKSTSAKLDEQRNEIENSSSSSKRSTPADRFKKAFSRDNVRVHFVGVW